MATKKVVGIDSKTFCTYGTIKIGGFMRYEDKDYQVVKDGIKFYKSNLSATVKVIEICNSVKVNDDLHKTRGIFDNYRVSAGTKKAEIDYVPLDQTVDFDEDLGTKVQEIQIPNVDKVYYDDGTVELYRYANGKLNYNSKKTIFDPAVDLNVPKKVKTGESSSDVEGL